VLWRRTIHHFDYAPFCLIQEGLTVEVEKNKKNTKWWITRPASQPSRTQIGVFRRGEISALFFAVRHSRIKTALHHRLHGDDDDPSLPNARISAIISDIKAEFYLGDDGREIITTILIPESSFER